MAWSQKEVDRAIAVYFEMFKRQLRGEDFVKVEYLRELASDLDGRTKAAATRKFHNISAVLAELGYPHMQGYTTQSHYQKLLEDRVEEYLRQDHVLHDLLDEEAAGRPQEIQVPASPKRIMKPPPEEKIPQESPRIAKQIDYVERERRNRNLGKAGEEYVVELEERRLRHEDNPELAKQVEWVAETRGDGLGYDVLSFENNGEERYVEVKTTKQGKSLPFYLTATELRFSREAGDRFYLYRLFDFAGDAEPSLYVLNGPVDNVCSLTPKSFQAIPTAEESSLAVRTG
ncbi:hypothetical protein GGP53_001022 [Salinibacter ruber]|uniref:DUF3883 domain-containing protein n=1 Tax=Salinibacter ruber TaxID=146919 RepID=UPI00216A6BBB|nr:DUF3883 domain-containing protein [Salinibacter ruber]MCS3627181.1 hypothetical protein [Salinibacter ruber]MCS4144088.1 hypothetical protein [Salinibacter ruber]